MDRQIIYSGQIPLSTDLLNAQKNAYVALLKLAAGILGTSTLVNGLSCVPTSPASLSVIVNPGEVYSLQTLDPNAYSDLGADSHTVLKQGIISDPVTLTLQGPSTIGYSVNYLIEAAFSEADTDSLILPYYNSSNPAQPYSGPGGTAAAQNTTRQDTVLIRAKIGIAAPAGSQATPAVDVGYTGLFVVTVGYGQTTIGSDSIVQVSGAPFITETLTEKISIPTADLRYVRSVNVQNGLYIYSIDTGSANAYLAAFTPAISAPQDGMVLIVTVRHSNTGPSTLNGYPIYGLAGQPLQGGEMPAGGRAQFKWNASLAGGVWILLNCEGGPLQIAGATQSKHAVNLGQFVFSAGNPGYSIDPSGKIEQWGTIDFGSNKSEGLYGPYDFPYPFPNACLNIQFTTITPEYPGQDALGDNVIKLSHSYMPTKTQFWVWNDQIAEDSYTIDAARGFTWRATGW